MKHVAGGTQSQVVDPSVVDASRAEMQRVLATAVELHQQGSLEQAEQLYRVLIGVDPQHSDALHLLGVLASQAGSYESAIALFQRAIAARPNVPQYHFNLGVSMQSLERNAEAEQAYETALHIQPDYREAVENLGVVRQEQGKDDGAVRAYRRAIRLNSRASIAHRNLGTLLLGQGNTHAATDHFDKALAQNPAVADVHWKLAAAYLQQGHYGAGWDEYEWRYCSADFVALNPPAFAPYPKWTGAPLADKTILVTPEQGVGDEVLFASCYEDLIELAGHCVIRCDPRLTDLYRRSFPATTVVPTDATLRDISIDCRISAGSLPHFLRREAGSFPAHRQFLWSDEKRQARWRDWLQQRGSSLKVGISWRGGLKRKAREARSAELAAWRELLSVGGASFFSIQYGDHDAEIAEFNAFGAAHICQPDGLDPQNGLDDLAAFISALDLVITVDNSTTHFAGALGAPTWVLLPACPEWRWREEDGGNRWFPSLELFAQSLQTPGNWQPVLKRLTGRLRNAVDNGVMRPQMRARPAPNAPVSPTLRGRGGSTGTKTLLINDTTNWYHWGCTSTSLAVHDQLRAAGHDVSAIPIRDIVDMHVVPQAEEDFDRPELFATFEETHSELLAKLDDADLIYVNGEGTLHRLSHQATAMLYLIRIASAKLGKRVRLVNHSCYPEGNAALQQGTASRIYSKVYDGLDYIAVRESSSAALLRAMGLQVSDSFDCLPLYVENLYVRGTPEHDPYVVLAGGVAWQREALSSLAALVAHARRNGLRVKLLTGANAFPAGDEPGFVEAIWQACGGEVELACATSESHWLDVIAGARLLVSGRFHHSIAAAFLGTPFVVSQSNTPKITGLLDMLQLDALLATPENWSREATENYTGRLLDKAGLYLDRPQACTLKGEVREELLAASLRNFADPA